jgi:hypothetical protein
MLKQSRKVDFYYTAEEAENIFNRLPEHENNKYHRAYVAVNLFFTPNEEFDEYCRENNIPLKAIVGYPPEDLRVAVLMNRRFGCKDMGRAEGVQYWRNGVNMPCRYMR